MAKGGRKQGSGVASGGPKSGPKGGKKGGRTSVAAARQSNSNRLQLVIGGVAIVVIIAIIVVGLVLHSKNSAVQGAGYGTSTKSVATLSDDGTITVTNGNPDLVLDIYEDALCPICAEFEHQYGQQIAKAIDAGQLTVRYHMVDFLNRSSASGTYSTRAYAALMAVAKNDGSEPGRFMTFHTAIYDKDNQPTEGGSSDLSNDELADLAGDVGASDAAQDAISSGAQVDAAKSDAQENFKSLTAVAATVGRSPGTPTVAQDGVPINTNATDWLTKLLPAGSADTTGDAGQSGSSDAPAETTGN